MIFRVCLVRSNSLQILAFTAVMGVFLVVEANTVHENLADGTHQKNTMTLVPTDKGDPMDHIQSTKLLYQSAEDLEEIYKGEPDNNQLDGHSLPVKNTKRYSLPKLGDNLSSNIKAFTSIRTRESDAKLNRILEIPKKDNRLDKLNSQTKIANKKTGSFEDTKNIWQFEDYDSTHNPTVDESSREKSVVSIEPNWSGLDQRLPGLWEDMRNAKTLHQLNVVFSKSEGVRAALKLYRPIIDEGYYDNVTRSLSYMENDLKFKMVIFLTNDVGDAALKVDLEKWKSVRHESLFDLENRVIGLLYSWLMTAKSAISVQGQIKTIIDQIKMLPPVSSRRPAEAAERWVSQLKNNARSLRRLIRYRK